MRLANRTTSRRGAVTIEAAIVIPIFLLLVLGTIDLSLGIVRQATLSQAARHGVRQAAVHGKLAPSGWKGGPWGPTAVESVISAEGIPIVDAVKPMLVNCPPSETIVRVEWPENKTEVGSKVRVTVTSVYRPMITYIFGGSTIQLRATSTMPIAH